MWNQYPKHMMEPKIVTPWTEVEGKPLKPVMEKKLRVSKQTHVIRKKFAVGRTPTLR